ncbi:MAG: hypothetical protein K9I82_06095 [Chitinophagaceae bacterium]|nr:hypothetical protein [Chitinophagaceae bacterium]
MENNDYDSKEMIKILRKLLKKEDIVEYMQEYYDDIMFLGTSIKEDKKTLDTIKYSIRLCSMYYCSVEEYRKVHELVKLSELLNSDKKSVVDFSIIDEVNIFEN